MQAASADTNYTATGPVGAAPGGYNTGGSGFGSNIDWGNVTAGLTGAGQFISSVFGGLNDEPPSETTAPSGQGRSGNEEDNTMLYLGIGGAVLLVIILIVIIK